MCRDQSGIQHGKNVLLLRNDVSDTLAGLFFFVLGELNRATGLHYFQEHCSLVPSLAERQTTILLVLYLDVCFGLQ